MAVALEEVDAFLRVGSDTVILILENKKTFFVILENFKVIFYGESGKIVGLDPLRVTDRSSWDWLLCVKIQQLLSDAIVQDLSLIHI